MIFPTRKDMAIKGGYGVHILRVDLTRGTIRKEPLPSEDVLRRYVGGTGLGLYYLLKQPSSRSTSGLMTIKWNSGMRAVFGGRGPGNPSA